STTLRLSPEVIEHFKSGGPGWQSRIDAALKDWVAAH
ncbi:BrnA antitoxin family protein, partial [Novosphingobium profundi]|nr:BrnA antitoxin family protein [Novosphingobium profundi]